MTKSATNKTMFTRRGEPRQDVQSPNGEAARRAHAPRLTRAAGVGRCTPTTKTTRESRNGGHHAALVQGVTARRDALLSGRQVWRTEPPRAKLARARGTDERGKTGGGARDRTPNSNDFGSEPLPRCGGWGQGRTPTNNDFGRKPTNNNKGTEK